MKRLFTSTAMILALGTAAVAQTATETDAELKKPADDQAAVQMESDSQVTADGDLASDEATNVDDEIAEAADEAGENLDQAANEVGEELNEAADESEAAMAEAGQEIDEATDEAAAEMAEAGDEMAPASMRDGYAPLEQAAASELTTEELEGLTVYDTDENNVGEIGTLVVSDTGEITDVVIEVGGFLGLGEKPVAIPFEEVEFLKSIDGDDVRAFVKANEESLEAMPEYEAG